MKRLRWLTVLMGITLLIIIGFQVYWIKDNYDREKRTMQIKTGVAFQETVRQLQVTKLKLPDMFRRSTDPGKTERILEEKEAGITDRSIRSHEMITTTRVVSKRLKSNIKKDSNVSPPIFIIHTDSNRMGKRTLPVTYKKYDSTLNKGEFGNEIFIEGKNIRMTTDRKQIITSINILRSKLNDSLKFDTVLDPSYFIRIPKDSNRTIKTTIPLKVKKNSNTNNRVFRLLTDSNNHAWRVLYAVDSLQDSLKLPEITKAFSATLKKQNINVPFSISKSDSSGFRDDQDLTDMTVGFAHPVTYRLLLGNTAPYLIKRISLPILFSFFLVAVTMFSFVLLYRNLLRQQRLGEIKNEFISNITHELKTPIATVGVAIEALKNFNAMHDPQKTKEYLDISANELQRLSLLVDKVLKLSMFEKKEIELNKESFDMKALTQEVLDTMKLQFEKNKAVVNFHVQGNDFIVNADKLHITSVIYNLLDNALKYSNGDPVINTHLADKQNNIELKVGDNGIGIAHEYQSKIFDKFFRVPTGNRHVVKGYGLGLSYVSHIIAQHNGTIHLESEIEKGSIFIIKIPKNA